MSSTELYVMKGIINLDDNTLYTFLYKLHVLYYPTIIILSKERKYFFIVTKDNCFEAFYIP